MIPAPICRRPIHDAHLWLILLMYFIAVTLPFQWLTLVLWSFGFCVVGFIQGLSVRFTLQSLAFAFVLSISIWLLNVFFHVNTVSRQEALTIAHQNALRVWSMTWVALLSSKMINLRDVITWALQRRWLPIHIAYALLVGIGSIGLLRAEVQRIRLNAQLRNIKGLMRFSQWIPLLIFALRHSQRGAMSLRARGLASHKVFYYDYQATAPQKWRSALLLLCLIGLTLGAEQLAL